MSSKLDQFLDEMLETEVDLQAIYATYSEGTDMFNDLLMRAEGDSHEATDEKITTQWEMRTTQMMGLAFSAGNEVQSAQMSNRRSLRDLDIPAFLEKATAEEEENFFGGTDFCRRMLEADNQNVADTLGTEPSTPAELDELAEEMAKVWRWVRSEAENWKTWIFLDVAERVYKLARTRRSDILAALDAEFGPEREEGLNDVELSVYLQGKVLDGG